MSNEVPRIGVIGCGYWGKNLVRNFAQLGALQWVCDLRPEQLAAQKGTYPGVRLTDNYEELLSDESVRGIVIASPAVHHHRHALQALAANKDVFIEKPLALDLSQGMEIVQQARRNNAVLMVGHILEYHPAVKELKKLVTAGALGEIAYVYSNRLNLGKVRREENILWSFAPHDISIISGLIGSELQTVTAASGCYLQPDIADVTTTNLSFVGGVRSHIFVSWLHPYKETKLVVIGDKQMAVFNDTVADAKLVIYDKGIEWRDGDPVARQTSETTVLLPTREPMREECAHFLDCIRTRQPPLTGGENALQVLRVLQACELSISRGGMPVRVDEVDRMTRIKDSA